VDVASACRLVVDSISSRGVLAVEISDNGTS
jgi:hypothetical protein